MLLFMALHLFQAIIFSFANYHFFTYEMKFLSNRKMNKEFLTILFTMTNLPFIFLAIKFNNDRNCQLFFTKFNLMDAMVTMFSTLYIIIEAWQIEQRQFKIVNNIIDIMMKKEQ